MKSIPRLRMQVLHHSRPVPVERVSYDFCAVEGVLGLSNLLKSGAADWLCFGSYYPFFSWEAAHLKMKEAGLSPEQLARLQTANARSLMEPAR